VLSVVGEREGMGTVIRARCERLLERVMLHSHLVAKQWRGREFGFLPPPRHQNTLSRDKVTLYQQQQYRTKIVLPLRDRKVCFVSQQIERWYLNTHLSRDVGILLRAVKFANISCRMVLRKE
jgi:hypothetical protein